MLLVVLLVGQRRRRHGRHASAEVVGGRNGGLDVTRRIGRRDTVLLPHALLLLLLEIDRWHPWCWHAGGLLVVGGGLGLLVTSLRHSLLPLLLRRRSVLLLLLLLLASRLLMTLLILLVIARRRVGRRNRRGDNRGTCRGLEADAGRGHERRGGVLGRRRARPGARISEFSNPRRFRFRFRPFRSRRCLRHSPSFWSALSLTFPVP